MIKKYFHHEKLTSSVGSGTLTFKHEKKFYVPEVVDVGRKYFF